MIIMGEYTKEQRAEDLQTITNYEYLQEKGFTIDPKLEKEYHAANKRQFESDSRVEAITAFFEIAKKPKNSEDIDTFISALKTCAKELGFVVSVKEGKKGTKTSKEQTEAQPYTLDGQTLYGRKGRPVGKAKGDAYILGDNDELKHIGGFAAGTIVDNNGKVIAKTEDDKNTFKTV